MNKGTFMCDGLEVPCWPAWCDDLLDCSDFADAKDCPPLTRFPVEQSEVPRDWGRQGPRPDVDVGSLPLINMSGK